MVLFTLFVAVANLAIGIAVGRYLLGQARQPGERHLQ
jgi:hypothetical protein